LQRNNRVSNIVFPVTTGRLLPRDGVLALMGLLIQLMGVFFNVRPTGRIEQACEAAKNRG
jgi:hypothetical protein